MHFSSNLSGDRDMSTSALRIGARGTLAAEPDARFTFPPSLFLMLRALSPGASYTADTQSDSLFACFARFLKCVVLLELLHLRLC